MRVIVTKAKKNIGKKDMACIVNCHGGGAVALKPEHLNGKMARLCLALDIVAFNIDYRLAPEAKTPEGFKDCVAAIKYFNQHAAEYGADPQKLSLTGDSGGAFIAMGCCILLLREEAQLAQKMINTLYLWYPMLNDHLIKSELNMVPEWEHSNHSNMTEIFHLIATDWENQQDDPLLYPGKLSLEECKLLPGVVLTTAEHDFVRRDVHNLVPKLKKAGVYVDHMDIAACSHGLPTVTQEGDKFELWYYDMVNCFAKHSMSKNKFA